MRWLVTGAKGMLGLDLVGVLEQNDQEVVAYDRDELDITEGDVVENEILSIKPEIIVNCAAWTAVDDAEKQEGAAFQVSAIGAANLARAAQAANARLVQISTDYVFRGDATKPYAENSLLAPTSAYGRTKAAGEWAVQANCPDSLIVRTAWLYGANGACFPRTIAAAGRSRDQLDVVSDQVGQPTWTKDVADLIWRLGKNKVAAGIYHATSAGKCSWFEFAQAIIAADGQDETKVLPTNAAAYDRPAPRPAYSVLSHDALISAGVEPIGAWRDRWDVAALEILGA